MKKITLLFSLFFCFTFYAQVANQPSDLILCDDNNDGFALFDLSVLIPQVLGSQNSADYSLSFYQTQADVETGINPITSPHSFMNQVSSSQTIYVRLEEVATGNYDYTSFDIIVNPLPSTVAVTSLELCDNVNAGDEQELFDLTTKDTEILNGQTNISVAYYQTLVDAETNTNSITGLYTNISNPQTIYASLTNTITSCYSLVTFDLLVNSVPVAYTPQPLRYCDPDNDGFGIFSLTDAGNEITGGAAGLVVTYYETLSNANNNVDAIDTSVGYNNIVVDTQTLYASVENAIATDCGATIVELQLILEPTPVFNIDDFSICVGDSAVAETGLDFMFYQFQWSYNGVIIPDNQGSLTLTEAGTYTVEVFDLNTNCTKTISFEAEFVDCAADMDSDNVSSGDEDIDSDGNLENDDTDLDGIPNYLDDDDDGDNVLTIDEDYNNNGDPTDDDTDMSGIPDYLEANVALSVNDYSFNNFNLYPNPANNRITIQLTNSNFESGNLNIYNIQGKMIFKDIKLAEQASTIDISNLERGLYFVELTVGNNSTVQKLIVN